MKRAVILGASSGLGQEVARLLIAEGWKTGVAARRTEPLRALRDLAPERVEVAAIDVDAEDAGERLLALIDAVGGMDLYFHAPGIGKQNPTLAEDVEMNTVRTNAMGFNVAMSSKRNCTFVEPAGTTSVVIFLSSK